MSSPKLHKIQWQILNKIKFGEAFRFNEIKFSEMDPKQFTYHLKRLVKTNLVEKDRMGNYKLSRSGKLFVDYYRNIPTLGDLPINTYGLLYVKRNDEILVVKRKREPWLGFIGNPSFNSEKEVFILETAKRNLQGLGLSGDLALNLIMEILYKNKKNKIITHSCIYVFYPDDVKGKVLETDNEGDLFWMKPKDLLNVEKGYENSKDLVEHFESKDFDRNVIKMVSREYKTSW